MTDTQELLPPRVKLVPVTSTWTCPKCERQNVYRQGIVSDPQDKCVVCGTQVILGVLRAADLVPSTPAVDSQRAIDAAKEIVNKAQQDEYVRGHENGREAAAQIVEEIRDASKDSKIRVACVYITSVIRSLLPTEARSPQPTVESALAALREMLPNESFTVEATFFNEVGPRVRIGLKNANRHFGAPTLTEALQKVREWREQE